MNSNLFLKKTAWNRARTANWSSSGLFPRNGANRQFVNGSPTTLNTLAAIGEWLVDIHGPHDHQSLLHPAKQLLILDAFGRLEKEREAFGELVRRRAALAAEKSALIVDEKTYAQQLDLLRFQVQEITAARLQPGEDERVEEEFNRASNAAKLLQLSQAALDALSESENSVLTQAGAVGRALQELQRVDPGAVTLAELHAQAVGTLRELQAGLSRYAEKVDVDPARLAELEERLDLIHSLKRKYGATLAEVIAFGEEAKQNCNRSKAAMRNWPASTPNCRSSMRTFHGRAKSFPTPAARRSRLWPKPWAGSSKIWDSSKASLRWH